MCTRFYIDESLSEQPYVQEVEKSALYERMLIENANVLKKSGEIRPTDTVAAFAPSRTGERTPFPMVWVSDDAVNFLRENKMVEGRKNNLYLSAEVSHIIDEEAQYIRNKAFDDQYYKDLIIQYLQQYGKAKKKDLRQLLIDKLPDSLSNKQKEAKLGNLLTSLRKKGVIKTSDSNQQKSYWILA